MIEFLHPTGICYAGITGSASYVVSPKMRRQMAAAAQQLVAAAGPNPRVPLAGCDREPARRPRGVDLLMPIQLGRLTPEQSLLAGRVTIVGKLVRAVRRPDDVYVDNASLATFSNVVGAVDAAAATTRVSASSSTPTSPYSHPES